MKPHWPLMAAWLLLFHYSAFTNADNYVATNPIIYERSIADIDSGTPSILNVLTDELVSAPRTANFTNERAFTASIKSRGDLAYENANGGLMLIASGYAAALGTTNPNTPSMGQLAAQLQQRDFLRGSEIAAGNWFAAQARQGEIILGFIVSRSAAAIKLRWSLIDDPNQGFSAATISALSVSTPQTIQTVRLPMLSEVAPTILQLKDGILGSSPELALPFSAKTIDNLVSDMGSAGDLAYYQPHSGMLIMGSGRSAIVGLGRVAELAQRDLQSRIKEKAIISLANTIPGNVLLIEATDGNYALLRINAIKADALDVTWLYQHDGSAIFSDLEAFDDSFNTPKQEELNQSLLTAVAQGQIAHAKYFISLGANANTVSAEVSRPAIIYAVINAQGAMLDLLLASGANPNGTDTKGWSALHVAVRLNHTELVKTLIKAGANPASKTLADEDALTIALKQRPPNTAILNLLPITADSANGLTAAIGIGDKKSVLKIIDNMPNINKVLMEGKNALQIAASSGQTDIVRLLLEKGADPAISAGKENSALVMATRANHIENVQALLEYGGSSEVQKNEALIIANYSGQTAAAATLLEAGVDVNATNENGMSPLNHALQFGSDELVSVYEDHGHTVTLTAAARLGRTQHVKKMLEAQNKLTKTLPPSTQAALQLAIKNNQMATIETMLEYGINPNSTLPTWDKRTLLHEVIKQKNPELTAVFIAQGAQPNITDAIGRTPLYEAVTLGQQDVARVLLEHGADPNIAPTGESLLEFARNDSFKALLLQYGTKEANPH
jgi:ankyrin repeat protein